MRTPTTSAADAARLIRADRQLFLDRIDGLPEATLREPFLVAGGHFCESLHDLMAHILMWDEITLAVLREAAAGRMHWSLDPRWETPDAGRALNVGGAEAGRHLSAELLVHRLNSVVDALVGEIEGYDERAWSDPATGGGFDGGIGALAEYVATPPGEPVYAHAGLHLGGKH